ncbi:MAG TPA: hypothetical protein VF199_05075 [Bacillales bacterium]
MTNVEVLKNLQGQSDEDHRPSDWVPIMYPCWFVEARVFLKRGKNKTEEYEKSAIICGRTRKFFLADKSKFSTEFKGFDKFSLLDRLVTVEQAEELMGTQLGQLEKSRNRTWIKPEIEIKKSRTVYKIFWYDPLLARLIDSLTGEKVKN